MDMNEFTLDGFEAIWARVQGRTEELPPTEPERDDPLLRFLEQEAESAAFERELVCRLQWMEPLHRCTCERFQLLRSLWFLKTGERFSLKSKCCTLRGPLLQDLRKDYLAVSERADRYAAAAMETADPDLRETYAELSKQSKTHAERLITIIRRMLDHGGCGL